MSDTKLSYSSAIRLGSMLKPQGFGIGRDRQTTACANDAARLAVGALREDIEGLFPLAIIDARCPQCGSVTYLAFIVATHLNDAHHWTRERIADFVQSIEEQQATPKAAQPELAELAGGAREAVEVGAGR